MFRKFATRPLKPIKRYYVVPFIQQLEYGLCFKEILKDKKYHSPYAEDLFHIQKEADELMTRLGIIKTNENKLECQLVVHKTIAYYYGLNHEKSARINKLVTMAMHNKKEAAKYFMEHHLNNIHKDRDYALFLKYPRSYEIILGSIINKFTSTLGYIDPISYEYMELVDYCKEVSDTWMRENGFIKTDKE